MLWLAAGGKTTDRSLHRIAVNVRARACESSHCRGLIDQSCCYADRGVAGCWPTLPVVSSWQQHGSAASECYSLTCARTHPARVCVFFFIISVINVQPQYRRNQHGRHVLSTEVPFYTRWLHLIKAGAWSFGQSSATSSHACTPAHPHEWTPQHQVVVQIHPHTSDSHCVDKAVASLIQTLKSLGHRLTLAFRFSSNCQLRRK